MRSRTVLLVVAILLVAGFAALNWSEIVRPSPLLFGPIVMDAPLGAILLGVLALTLVLFLVSTAAMRTQSLIDYRTHTKTLEAQRELADKAEASRFIELRQHLDTHLKDMRERDAIAATEMEKARLENQREIRTQLEQINRTIAARMNELEHRLESRFERMGVSRGALPATTPVVPPVRSEGVQGAPLREHAMADHVHTDPERRNEQLMREQQAREAHLHDVQRQEEERMRQMRAEEQRPGEGKPESGWRRWF